MAAPEDLAQWRFRAEHVKMASHWRAKACGAMYRVVVNHTSERWLSVESAQRLMEKVDEAYPFGERERHPYKAWLAERQLLVTALASPATPDEYGACEVALDLVEMGRECEAAALLTEQAPNRHARPCPVCGQRVGYPCREPDLTDYNLWGQMKMKERIVPHVARVQPKEETS